MESADSPQSCLYLGKLAPKYFEHLLALGATAVRELVRVARDGERLPAPVSR